LLALVANDGGAFTVEVEKRRMSARDRNLLAGLDLAHHDPPLGSESAPQKLTLSRSCGWFEPAACTPLEREPTPDGSEPAAW